MICLITNRPSNYAICTANYPGRNDVLCNRFLMAAEFRTGPRLLYLVGDRHDLVTFLAKTIGYFLIVILDCIIGADT